MRDITEGYLSCRVNIAEVPDTFWGGGGGGPGGLMVSVVDCGATVVGSSSPRN